MQVIISVRCRHYLMHFERLVDVARQEFTLGLLRNGVAANLGSRPNPGPTQLKTLRLRPSRFSFLSLLYWWAALPPA